MPETTVVAIAYEGSKNKELQGKRSKIDKYLDDGYHIKIARNGYWALTKPAQINVTLKNGDTKETFDMKEDVCDHYDRKRISEPLVEKFRKDVVAGKINIVFEPEEGYSFD